MSLALAISVGGVADEALSQAAQVVVEEGLMAPARYAIAYGADIEAGDLPMLADARLGPGSELMIVADAPGGAECLAMGPVHGQRIVLADSGEGSTLEVRGSDTAIVMARETKVAQWAEVTDAEAATAIIGTYGYVPDVESTAARHLSTLHALVQRTSDLDFLFMLARRNGAHFWVRCDPFGIQTAHLRRPDTASTPAHTLSINQPDATLSEVEIEWDLETPTSAVVRGLDPAAKRELDGDARASPLAPLGAEGPTAISSEVRSLHLAPAADDSGNLTARAEGALIDAGWFLRARCVTSVAALGAIVRPHSVVTLAGAGSRHSGNYYVSAVRHAIDAEAHRMEISLLRNAWGSDDTGIGLAV